MKKTLLLLPLLITPALAQTAPIEQVTISAAVFDEVSGFLRTLGTDRERKVVLDDFMGAGQKDVMAQMAKRAPPPKVEEPAK